MIAVAKSENAKYPLTILEKSICSTSFKFNMTRGSNITGNLNHKKSNELIIPKEFKTEIGKNKKVLYFQYNNISELSQFLRIHIPMRINDLKTNSLNPIKEVEVSNIEKTIVAAVIEEEFGLIDYQIMMQEYLNESKILLGNIN